MHKFTAKVIFKTFFWILFVKSQSFQNYTEFSFSYCRLWKRENFVQNVEEGVDSRCSGGRHLLLLCYSSICWIIYFLYCSLKFLNVCLIFVYFISLDLNTWTWWTFFFNIIGSIRYSKFLSNIKIKVSRHQRWTLLNIFNRFMY